MEILEWSVVVLLGLFLGYLAVLSLLAYAFKERPVSTPRKLLRFAFVCPAHNEQLVIERTIWSLRNVDYPPDLRDIFVVADNCTDATAARALTAGATVLERDDHAHRGKGYALQFGFRAAMAWHPPFDAFIVVDADSSVSPNFLRVLNAYLQEGAKAIQVADIVEQKPGSWSVEATRIALLLNNVARPLGRKRIGCSAGLRGNGMCFARNILQHVEWNSFSLTEDLEYGLKLILKGIPVVFAPEAAVYAIMPQQAANAESQRARWEMGRFPVLRRYAPQLLRTFLHTGSVSVLDTLVDLITPAFVNMMALVFAVMGLRVTLILFFGEPMSPILWAWAGLAMAGIVHVCFGLLAVNQGKLILAGAAGFPRYVLWKLKLYSGLLFQGLTREWVRTTRETGR